MMDRRSILTGSVLTGAALMGSATVPAPAQAQSPDSDVRKHGVIPDAARNQSAALQGAINQASAAGGELFLPPGTYVATGLQINQPLMLNGVPGRTRIITPSDGPILQVSGTNDVVLNGLVLDGAGTTGGAGNAALLAVRQCQDFALLNCRLINSAAGGLTIERSTGHITHNTIASITTAAIQALDTAGLNITANHVRDCQDNGILVWQSEQRHDGAIVSGNHVERIAARSGGSGQYGNGINLFRAGSVIVANNVITDCAYSAVRNNAGENVQIVNNTCARLGEVALFAEFAFKSAIISGNVVDTAAIGVSITNFSSGGRLAVCSGNVVTTLNQRPPNYSRNVGIAVEADTVVTGNVVENAEDIAYALGWGPYARNISATGNIARKCKYGFTPSVTEGAGKIMLSNNIVDGATEAALIGMDHDKPATGDLSRPGARMPANLNVTGNIVS